MSDRIQGDTSSNNFNNSFKSGVNTGRNIENNNEVYHDDTKFDDNPNNTEEFKHEKEDANSHNTSGTSEFIEENYQDALLQIFNFCFPFIKESKHERLEDVIQFPNQIKMVLIKSEPKFESTVGVLPIIMDDNPNTMITNYKVLLKGLEIYFSTHEEKEKFTELKDFKNFFSLTELIKGQERQINCFFEVLLVFCSLSSTKDAFLNQVCEMEMKFVNLFLANVEKYINVDQEIEAKEQNNSEESFTNSEPSSKAKEEVVISPAEHEEALLQIESLGIKIGEAEKDKATYLKQIQELEGERANNTQQIKKLNEEKDDILLNLNDAKKEIEALKQTSKIAIETQEELAKHADEKKQYDVEIAKLKAEIEKLVKDNDKQAKEHLDATTLLNAQVEVAEQKINQGGQVVEENDKLHARIRELVSELEKHSDYETIKALSEEKTKSLLEIEKQLSKYAVNEELLFKDLKAEQDNSREIDFQRKNLEIMIMDLKDKCARYEAEIRNLKSNNNDAFKRKSTFSLNEGFDLDRIECYNDAIGQIEELKEGYEAKIKQLDEQNKDLYIKAEEAEIKCKLTEDRLKMVTDERDQFYPREEELKLQIAKSEADKFKYQSEKEKIEKQKKKIEEELNELLDAQESGKDFDPVKYAEEIKEFKEKIDTLNDDREVLNKLIEMLKKEVVNMKGNVDSLLAEKEISVNNYHELEKQLSLTKDKHKKEIAELMQKKIQEKEQEDEAKILNQEKEKVELGSPKISISKFNILENEIMELKNQLLLKDSEIQNLRLGSSEKDDMIYQLSNLKTFSTDEDASKDLNKLDPHDKRKKHHGEAKLAEKIKEITEKYDSSICDLSKNIIVLKENETSLNAELVGTKKKIEMLNNRVETTSKEKVALLEEIGKLKGLLSELKEDDKNEKLLSLEEEVGKLKKHIKEIESVTLTPKVELKEHEELKQEYNELKLKLNQAVSQAQNLRLEAEKKDEKIESLNKAFKDLKDVSDKLRNDGGSSGRIDTSIINKLQEEKGKLQADNTRLIEELEKLRSLSSEHNDLNEKILKEKQELLDMINDLHSNLKELQKEGESQKEEYEEEIRNLKNELKSPLEYKQSQGSSSPIRTDESKNGRKSWISPKTSSPGKRATFVEMNKKESEVELLKQEIILKTSEIQNLKLIMMKNERINTGGNERVNTTGNEEPIISTENEKNFEERLLDVAEKVTNQKQSIEVLENNLLIKTKEVESGQELLEKALSDKKRLESEVKAMREEIRGLNEKYNEEVSGMKGQQQTKEDFEELKKTISKLQEELGNTKLKIVNLNSDNQSLKIKCDLKDESLHMANERLQSFEKRDSLSTKAGSILTLEEEKALKETVSNLKDQLVTLKNQLYTTEDMTNKLFTEKEELNILYKKLESERLLHTLELENEKNRFDESLVESSKVAGYKTNQILNLESEIKALKEEVDFLKTHQLEADTELKSLSTENNKLQEIIVKKSEKIQHDSEGLHKAEKKAIEAENKAKKVLHDEKELKANLLNLRDNNVYLSKELTNSHETNRKLSNEVEEFQKTRATLKKEIKMLKEKLENSIPVDKIQDLQHQLLKNTANLDVSNRELKLLQKENQALKEEIVMKNNTIQHLQEDFIRVNSELKTKIDLMSNSIKNIEDNDDYILNMIDSVKKHEMKALGFDSDSVKVRELNGLLSKKDDIIYIIAEKVRILEKKIGTKAQKKEEEAHNLKTISELQHTIKLKDEYIKSDWRIIEQLKLEISTKGDSDKGVKDRIKQLEAEIASLQRLIRENNERFIKELNKRTEDINFYKLSCEEMKRKTGKEHDMLTNCLYDLASQFVHLKQEVIREESPKGNCKPKTSSTSKLVNKSVNKSLR